MSVQLKLTSGSGKVELSDANFGADFNEALIHQVVTAYLAGGRSGTSAQKNRSAVSGGGKKPWRQKGTGRARAGTIRSPIFTGGGVTFPSQNRSYAQKVNRKMFRGALRSIWSELARQDRLIVIDELSMKTPNTKKLAAKLNKLEASNALIVLAEQDDNVMLSARNIKNIATTTISAVDPVSLVAFEKVIISSDALKQIDEALA